MDDLLAKYRYLARNRAAGFAGAGADLDDLIQTGMIGLWRAIQQFRPERAVSFRTYADVCIRRHIISAIKVVRRDRCVGLQRLDSLDAADRDGSAEGSVRTLQLIRSADPESRLFERERMTELCAALDALLSDFEWAVLAKHQSGRAYREIADDLGCGTKAVDNALGRIRRKVASIAHAPSDLCDWTRIRQRRAGRRKAAMA